jgi:prevent-host-death family protein
MRRLKLSEITGSLSEYARKGLSEPVVITKRGQPVVAVMPLTKHDDWESVSLSTNRKFMEIIERSRQSARSEGSTPLSEIRRKYGLPVRKERRRSSR